MRILHFSWTLRKPRLASHVLTLSRSVLALISSQSQIREEGLSWWSVVVTEVRLSLELFQCSKVGQVKMFYFYQQLSGGSNISPTNTDNQIFAVAHNIAKYL